MSNYITVMASRTTGEQKSSRITVEQALGATTTFGTPGMQAVVASGSSQSTATPIAQGGAIKSSAGDGTKGCTLPSTASGAVPQPFYNTAAGICPVYPNTSSGTINGGSAGAAVNVAAGKSCWFIPLDGADNWFTIPVTPS